MFRPEGIFAALPTPFGADESLDFAALVRLVEHVLAGGADGVCPLGGTGEPLSQSVNEHKAVLDTLMEAVDRRAPVLVGCLRTHPDEVVSVARYAASLGADAVMLIPPCFVQATPAHVERHFLWLAERIDLPIVLFNSPGRAGQKLSAEAILRLVEKIPHLVGIKEASGDLELAGELLRAAPARFAVLQGFDELVLPSLALGAAGAVVSLAALVPDMLAGIRAAFLAGDLERARSLQLALLPLARAVYAEPNPAPLKRALELSGIPAGPTRPPLFAIAPETEARLVRALDALAGQRFQTARLALHAE